MSVISGGIYSGLYCGGISPDVSHGDALVLARFDGITTGTIAIDLYLFASSHQGSVSLGLLHCLGVFLHHSFIDVYCHMLSFLSLAKPAYQACLLFIVEHRDSGRSTGLVMHGPHQIANEPHTPQEQHHHRDHEQHADLEAVSDDDPAHDKNKQYQHSGYQHGGIIYSVLVL